MSVPAAAVRELHRIHKQLTDLRDRLQRGAKQLKAREANIGKMSEELARLQADHKAARVRSDQKQLLLKSGEDKIEGLKAKLNAAASNREYQALKDQIAADQMAGSVLADEILEIMEKIDELAKQTNEQQQKINASKEELAKAQQSVRDAAGVLDSDTKRLEAELAQAEANLPADFRDQYQRLVNSKADDAMAEVQGEFCGGCFQQLTPNNMAELSMSLSIFCRNCGRMIYLPER
ncbi:MAG: zinc ribbon domain-containing protein [Pirellulales bacterium]